MSDSEHRIQPLQSTANNVRGNHVVYWMQQSQRVPFNHALAYAIQMANKRKQPLRVVFGLTNTYPEANWRHFQFMIEGLFDISSHLSRLGIAFHIDFGHPAEVALRAARHASLLVCDRGYLRHQRLWRRQVALSAPCPVIQVESDIIVPVETSSTKAEYAARTIRPKIQRVLSRHLQPLALRRIKVPDLSLSDHFETEALFSQLDLDRSVQPVSNFLYGGHTVAKQHLKTFIKEKLPYYDQCRNHPEKDGSSILSPYLHFGQISPLEIVLAVDKADAPPTTKHAFLEELIVRRELAVNHAFYCPDYDNFNGLPQWARQTLQTHSKDEREPHYTPKELENATTHDPYWNAAMREMKHTGYMHNYMRMYWGKKILQWRPNPESAYQLMLRMNNKYFIDGRDPNSYTGVGWIFGLHDQAWKERPIFGKIRYMARKGLERKFDMDGYVRKVNHRITSLFSNQ